MISIRTGLVAAAFVAMGLTSIAERLADRTSTDAEPLMTVGAEEAMPAKVLRLTQRTPAAAREPDLSPWI